MSIYGDIQKYATPKSSEVDQFRALMKAISKMGYTNELHGTKHQVTFDNPLATAHELSCELCDVLIFVYKKNEARYTFLQNKKTISTSYKPAYKINIPLRQKHLLGEFPYVKMRNKELSIPSDIFKNRILDSIGSIGVFYADKMGMLNMDYSIMSLMKLGKVVTKLDYDKNRSRVHEFNGVNSKVRTINHFDEVESCNNLIEFEKHLINMKIGEPITSTKQETSMYVIGLIKEILIKDSSQNVEKYLNDIEKISKFNEIHQKINNDNSSVNYPNFKIAIIDVDNN